MNRKGRMTLGEFIPQRFPLNQNLCVARRIEVQCKMQSEKYEVQNEDLHGILHFCILHRFNFGRPCRAKWEHAFLTF